MNKKENTQKLNTKYDYKNKSHMEFLYKKYRSGNKIASFLSVDPKTIYIWMKNHGIISDTGSQGKRKHFFNERYFEKIDKPEKAYLLGFITADGCVYNGLNKTSFRFQMNLKESDSYILDFLQKEIGSDYKIQFKEVSAKKNGNKSKVALLKINSTAFCKDLINLNVIPRKSMKESIPLDKIPNEFLRYFVLGYFDGDGSISYTKSSPHISILGSKKMCEQLNKIFVDNGIDQNVFFLHPNKKLFGLRINNTENKIKLYNFLYKDYVFFLKRKKETFDSFVLNKNCPLIK